MFNRMLGGVLLCLCALSVSAVTLNKIVAFGDSLSDNGNLYEYMDHQLPLSPPYYKGRFSNGPVWIELLTNKYYPNSSSSYLLDYAFGGSGIEGQFDEPDDTLFTLNHEIDSYLLSHQDKAYADSLYVIWIGGNNYFALPDDMDTAVRDVIWGTHEAVKRLESKGAKHILLMNLPNLGQLPIARDMDATDSLTYCSTQHNMILEQSISKWRAEYPNLHLMFFDVSKDFGDMIKHPENHGLKNVTDTCYESLIDSEHSHQTVLKMVASVKGEVKQDSCAGYMFFDLIHPSVIVHQELADKVAKLLKNEQIKFK